MAAFDALCVDLYDHEAASPVLDDEVFYRHCWQVLDDGGVMTVNLFGRDASFERSTSRIAGRGAPPPTSALIASEVVVAGILGVTLAGDHAKPGLAWLALLGVAMVLVGALDLARFSAELEGAVDEAS